MRMRGYVVAVLSLALVSLWLGGHVALRRPVLRVLRRARRTPRCSSTTRSTSASYTREGRLQDEALHERLRYWRTEPMCDTAGTSTLAGGWLDATGAHDPEPDGDIRLP